MRKWPVAILILLLSSACITKSDGKMGFYFPGQKTRTKETKARKKNRELPKTNTAIKDKGPSLVAGSLGHLSLSSSLDHTDKEYILRTTQLALESASAGDVKQWRNPGSGNKGSIRLTSDPEADGDQVCRKYVHTLVINGKTEKFNERACRHENGTWVIRT